MSRIFCSLSQKSPWSEVIQEIDQMFRPTWVATASTAFYLRDLGCQVKSLDELGIKAFGLGGKVKSLHPNLYRAILADRNNEDEVEELREDNLLPFDMVLIDIYQLQSGSEFALEQIDIGGPSALRAACKNFNHCLPVGRPEILRRLMSQNTPKTDDMYQWLQNIPRQDRSRCASDVMMMLSEVNRTISQELLKKEGGATQTLTYGDNPLDRAWVNPLPTWDRQQIQNPISVNDNRIRRNPTDMKFSWNNLMDIHQALSLFQWIKHPYKTCIMKHHHPCGVGYSDESIEDAFLKAHHCDPLSAFGGVVVLNHAPSAEFASLLKGLFIDLLVIPSEPTSGFDCFTKSKPNVRCMALPMDDCDPSLFQRQRHLTCFGEVDLQKWRSLEASIDDTQWTIYEGKQELTKELRQGIKHAYAISAHLHSNAVTICNLTGTLGIGVGFVNRVKAILHAVKQAKEFQDSPPIIVASDGFMPFADNIEVLDDLPVDIVVQPGGSKRDAEVIQACQDRGFTLVMTGSRVFFHGI